MFFPLAFLYCSSVVPIVLPFLSLADFSKVAPLPDNLYLMVQCSFIFRRSVTAFASVARSRPITFCPVWHAAWPLSIIVCSTCSFLLYQSMCENILTFPLKGNFRVNTNWFLLSGKVPRTSFHNYFWQTEFRNGNILPYTKTKFNFELHHLWSG